MVAVCVAPTDLRPEVDDLTGTVRSDLRRADLPAAEAAALEYGLRIAEEWGGWVLVACCGSAAADDLLREARALGAEVVRVGTAPSPTAGPLGPLGPLGPHPVAPGDLAGHPAATAAALAGAIRGHGQPALVLCGDRSGGAGVGAVPAFLAAELGLGQSLGLVSVRTEGVGRLVVERRLDGGWRERLAITGPAVLSVEGAGVRLRRAGLDAVLESAGAPFDVRSPNGSQTPPGEPVAGGMHTSASRPYRPRTRPVPAPTGDAHERLLALTGALSDREPARVVGPLTAAEAADELLAYLARRGYTT